MTELFPMSDDGVMRNGRGRDCRDKDIEEEDMKAFLDLEFAEGR
jgi:hypothetical protein